MYQAISSVVTNKENNLYSEQNEEGAVIRQSCRADGSFEFCTWKSARFQCNFEWKRSHGAVRKIRCHPPDISDRVR